MEWLESFRFYLSFSLAGLILIGISIYTWKQWILLLRRPGKIDRLLKGFRAKMWMTVGLGLVFFNFYLLLVAITARLLDNQTGAWLFATAYSSPKPLIYLGLLTFASISLAIYLARMVIKYLFLTYGKGD